MFATPRTIPKTDRAFSLLELLVVISIISLLLGLLLPALARSRTIAKVAMDLSNLRQVGLGVVAYTDDADGYYPKHSSGSSGPWPGFSHRPRWPDYIFPYVNDTQVFLNPLLSTRELEVNFQKPFAHDPTIGYGGYGYNFQYLGNSRFDPVLHAHSASQIRAASQTVVVGDTAGSRSGNAQHSPGDGASAVYVLDPPLASQRRAHPDGRAYYPKGSVEEPAGQPDTYLWRSFPAQRMGTDPGFCFVDGHAALVELAKIDDYNGDRIKDNGFWNGLADPATR